MSNKLFVGNLAWSITSERLREVFSEFGPITEAKVLTDRQTGRSRGFGFVTFENEDDANRATAEMNNKEVDGRAVRCDNSQENSRKDKPRENRNQDRDGRPFVRRDRDDNRSNDDKPKREFSRRDDHSRSYEHYNNVDFPPDPDKISRNNRRDNRKKDRDYDDDRW